jgi:hypothetical protein
LTASLHITSPEPGIKKDIPMKIRSLALLLSIAAMVSACATKENKPEPLPPAVVTSTPPADQPMASVTQSNCQPTKSTKTTTKGKKGSKPAVADCPPPAKAAPVAAAAPTVAAPAPAPAAKSEPGKPRIMKSRDGTFEGEVYGNIPAGSKWSRLIIGMEQAEVERILGGTSNEVRVMPTGKAFIPFYYGTDRHRYEVVYRGQGSVSYTGGSWGGGRGVLMMINYDPNI